MPEPANTEPKPPEPSQDSREELLKKLREIYPGIPDEQLIEESNGLV